MKPFPNRVFVVIALALVFAAARAPAADTIDVSGYPPEQQKKYEVFRVRCSKCHSLARPISARLRRDDWRKYIDKMARRPGSGISAEAGDEILEFLTYRESRRDADKAAAEKAPDAGVR